MKVLYLECNMGAAGDMLMGALADLLPDREGFADRMNALGLPGVHVELRNAVKCGVVGTHAEVTVSGTEEESLEVPMQGHAHNHDHEHTHSHEHEHPHTHTHAHVHEYAGEQHKAMHDHREAYTHDHAEIHDHDHGNVHEHPHTHTHTHTHVHRGMAEIEAMIERLEVSEKVKEDVKNIYRIIAEAEASVHGTSVSDIHFHEVGTADALADITGCALLMEELGVEKVVTSPINVGYGQVRCAHGILPVPAPAAARILEGVPCYAGNVEGELCTPTGAAVLKYYTDEFRRLPQMVIRKTGYGMGKKDFPAANCVRAVLGEQ